MAQKTIAVLFGGRSPEHDVSVVSALQVMGALDRSLYHGCAGLSGDGWAMVDGGGVDRAARRICRRRRR